MFSSWVPLLSCVFLVLKKAFFRTIWGKIYREVLALFFLKECENKEARIENQVSQNRQEEICNVQAAQRNRRKKEDRDSLEASPVRRTPRGHRGARVAEETPKWIRLH